MEKQVRRDPMRVYIAQPMQGLNRESIEHERHNAMYYIRRKHSENDSGNIEFINSYNPEWDVDYITPLEALGKALQMLAKADIAYFIPGWEDSRGCMIEAECCRMYGIPMASISAKDLGQQL